MNKNSALDLMKAYRLAITKNELEIADLLEHIIIEEVCVIDIPACNSKKYRTSSTRIPIERSVER
jgi:hypothetical protein